VVAPEQSEVKVGVGLAPDPQEIGEWLADAAAFDAAGAHALWVNLGAGSELDPLGLVAAIAVVTSRALLFTTLPGSDRSTEAQARLTATVERLSHGRLRILADDRDEDQHWFAAAPPDSRTAWRTTLAEAAEQGFEGVLVPASPRLLDILRNPEEPGERRDLYLAQG
jgi:alkanesulfonate monooxygenase SsuD/methylene tetrahydromethanopterin reductase-like flavin-dependent oxidoreductase (luciferase family)